MHPKTQSVQRAGTSVGAHRPRNRFCKKENHGRPIFIPRVYIFTSPCYFECMYTPILDTFRCQPRLSSKSSPCESLPSWCKQRPTHFNQKAVKSKHTSIARWSRKWCFLLITTVKHALRPKRLLSMSLIKGIRIQLAATASWQASAPRLRA